MIEMLTDLNTKSAVLYLVIWMTLFNFAATSGVIGIFLVFQSHRRDKMRKQILEQIKETEAAILKRINAFLSAKVGDR